MYDRIVRIIVSPNYVGPNNPEDGKTSPTLLCSPKPKAQGAVEGESILLRAHAEILAALIVHHALELRLNQSLAQSLPSISMEGMQQLKIGDTVRRTLAATNADASGNLEVAGGGLMNASGILPEVHGLGLGLEGAGKTVLRSRVLLHCHEPGCLGQW